MGLTFRHISNKKIKNESQKRNKCNVDHDIIYLFLLASKKDPPIQMIQSIQTNRKLYRLRRMPSDFVILK